ncbi:MAG: DNA-directed RNA polymerase subunit beta [Candidatus Wildermuthbacteria bacterium GWA2_46_15]|uniref:DNA-directed RNA polymerase subunit beta n=1 Tax=Candidatus Wildermuthbacteria bacterium GWA2_46_15 TaxID=1802443 RepID=A0A1G2QP30_9BACT|nr:MAG: DNA-directed RNA polymerase subunit beta [Candidatus Wildermuthbacteria bacterium GWA2_46_15]
MNVKSFSKAKVSFRLPYLGSLQRDSWQWLLERGIKDLFAEVSPIRDYTKKEFELWFLDYELSASKYKDDLEAKNDNGSYEASLRAKTRLINLKTKEIKEQEVFLADFPIMTERGTFIVNGVERVAIAQLIRSPGVFFTSQRIGGRHYFGAKVIPNRGAWLEMETDATGFVGIKIDRKRRVAATTLLRAFGIDNDLAIKELFSDIDNDPDLKYLDETLKKDPTHNQAEALVEIYERLRPGDLVTPDTARELIENMFFNFERYDLSRVGRWRMNQRFSRERKTDAEPNAKQTQKFSGDEVTVKERVLRPEDIVAVIHEIIRLNNTPGALPDPIDHLGNRRVRTSAEVLQNRMRVGMLRMERIIKDRISTLEEGMLAPSQLINPRPLMAVIKEFFTSSQLCQFMDNENPLAELEHKRRLAATGPGGLTRERAGLEVRDVQPSHYGRICPIQTPEGQNVGLISHMACFARINSLGFLETPYFKVENGKITGEVHYLNAYEEERYNIAHAGIDIDKNGQIIPAKVAARIKGEPGEIEKEKINFIDVSSKQAISAATSLIPFLQNDDANRALMGSNMQRQAVPLLNPEAPLVCTGVEPKVAEDSGQILLARDDGRVTEVDAQHIVIQNTKTRVQTRYPLRTFVRTNQYTCFHQRPVVKKGEPIKKGQVLTDGAAIEDGWLALGRNILVSFLPWRGSNFEDAIIISEKLVKEYVYSSIHLENFFCDVRETKLGPELTTGDIPNVSEEKLKDLDSEGIIRIGAEVGSHDILVGKISPKGETDLTPEERLLKAIFGERAREVKDSSLLLEYGKRGRVVGVKVWEREKGAKLEPGIIKRVQVEVAALRKIQTGDKLAGRHGNKGVVSLVLPEEEMPFLEDGTPVDIILNPLSVASRMNLGQILETHLGLAAKKLGYRAVSPALLGANEKDIKEELIKAGYPADGKLPVFDGRTGEPFPEKITVGYIYMMQLIHMVEDKLHMRSIGPYSLITQQPLGGKSQFGGQRFGEMEVWSLEGYGASHILQEMLTIKSDDVPGRAASYEAILKGEPIRQPSVPASFSLLVAELKSLGLAVEVKEKMREEEKEE